LRRPVERPKNLFFLLVLAMRKAIAERLQNCGLEFHPEKTKIVYCKDDDRRRAYPHEKFDFLGYTFRAWSSMTCKRKHFVNFSPAISEKAAQGIRTEVRSWKLPQRTHPGF
jgi:RNA-directed DNA polymerase